MIYKKLVLYLSKIKQYKREERMVRVKYAFLKEYMHRILVKYVFLI